MLLTKTKKNMNPVLGNRPMVSLRGPMAILVRPHSFVPVSLVWPNASHLTPVRTQWRFLVRPHSFVPFDLWEKSHRLIQIKDNFWFSLIKNVLLTKKIKTIFGNRPMVSLRGPMAVFGTATLLCPGVPCLAEPTKRVGCRERMSQVIYERKSSINTD